MKTVYKPSHELFCSSDREVKKSLDYPAVPQSLSVILIGVPK